jgi:hypothetical protein
MRIFFAGLEFCAHVGVDFAAQNDFFKNGSDPSHDYHLLGKKFFARRAPLAQRLKLKNHIIPSAVFLREKREKYGPNGPFSPAARSYGFLNV